MAAVEAYFNVDEYTKIGRNITAPPRHFFAITPSDDNELPSVVRQIRVGGAGAVEFVGVGDTESVTETYEAGDYITGFIKQVKATGTTATGLVGRW